VRITLHAGHGCAESSERERPEVRALTVWRMEHTSTACKEKATTVTAAHHSILRHLYDSMHTAQKPKSKFKFVTLDKESNMSTLWRREEFLRICSKEDLAEKAQDIGVKIPVKKSQEARYNLDSKSLFVNRF